MTSHIPDIPHIPLGIKTDLESAFSLYYGDFNARTNTDPYYVDNTEHEALFGLNLDSQQLDTIPKYRNSRDTSSTCQRGNKLIDTYKSQNLTIMEGRKMGDLFGEFTCFRHNVQTTVDYGICSAELLPDISYFKVGDYIPWLSDQTPISHSLMPIRKKVHYKKENKL